jgi:ribonuclease HI
MRIYTDGSSINNGKMNARAGVGVWFEKDDSRNLSEPLLGPLQTNNRAELTAILRAMEILFKNKENLDEDIVIVSDSKYSINATTVWIHNWKKNAWKSASKKPVKNKDIIQQIDCLMQLFKKLRFQYTKAHTTKMDRDSIGNRNADRLAVLGASTRSMS